MLTDKTKYHFPSGYSKWQSLLRSFSFLKNPIQAITGNMEKFSGTYTVELNGTGKLILTQDPDFISYVLRENHSNYQKSVLSAQTAARLFGNGLLFSNGEPWLKQRRLIQPGFHHSKIQGLYEIIIRTARDFITGFPTGEKIDVYPFIHRLSFSVLIHSLFDIDLSAQTVEALSLSFTDMQDFLMKDINQPFRRFFYPITKEEIHIQQKSESIRQILKEIIQQRRASGEEHNDLLEMLLNARFEDSGEVMKEDPLIDEILVLLFAGHETTANTLCWILYLVAANRNIQEKLKSVVDRISIYDSSKNEYMNAVINESMRLYPAAWMTDRVALKDDQFGKYSFPKGTIVIPFFFGVHRNKAYWENETTFDPERFISGDHSEAKKIKHFFPFGSGPRMCIGNNFAMAEMSFILYECMKKFTFTSTEKKPEMRPLITLRPRNLFLDVQRNESITKQ